MNTEQARRIMAITKETYELIAGEFSATRSHIWPEMEILVKKYVQPGAKVLDLGCGNGRLAEALPEVKYVGVDGCDSLAAEAKKNYALRIAHYEFRALDMLELEELGEKDFDVVFMFASLNHIAGEENRKKVLRDAGRILKPGGVVVMTNWNMFRVGGKSIWKYKLQFPRYKIQFPNKLQTQNPNFQPSPKSRIQKFGLGFKDTMTLWQSGDKTKSGQLYYRAFSLREIEILFEEQGFKVVENYYSLSGKKAHWWNGRNIVTVGKKLEIRN